MTTALSVAPLIIDPVFNSINSDRFGACFTSDVVCIVQGFLMCRVLLANTPKGFRCLTWQIVSNFCYCKSYKVLAVLFLWAHGPRLRWIKLRDGPYSSLVKLSLVACVRPCEVWAGVLGMAVTQLCSIHKVGKSVPHFLKHRIVSLTLSL